MRTSCRFPEGSPTARHRKRCGDFYALRALSRRGSKRPFRRSFGRKFFVQTIAFFNLRLPTRLSPVVRTKAVGQKVFCLFDPFSYFLRQKTVILDTLEFKGSFFISKKRENTPPTHSRKVG